MGENCSLAGLLVHAPFTRLAIVKFRTAVFCIAEKVLVGKITNIITLSFHDDSSSWVEQTMLFAVSKKSILFFSTYYGHLLLNRPRKKELEILGIELANESSFDSNALTRVATGVGFVADSSTDITFGSLSFDMTIDHLVCTRKKDNL